MIRAVLTPLAVVALCGAAPVPKQADAPPKLTADLMAGEWTMKWGSVDGTASLGADGGYYEVYGTTPYVGVWWIDGDEVVIVERRLNPETGELGGQLVFRFKASELKNGYFRGACNGTVLVLSK